ncbi:hypothetical protein EJ08DRAFT_610412 [Tothia fuscella]|uniref:RING-type E3 ubiquitin transferase n=1 Tax=Tothia fuscella TaxID=1048955 RepID=A0A9P4NUK5_9PEZI|nr:hypothetical protein EJ08DRAFT_610412 [Tothia fuscella]
MNDPAFDPHTTAAEKSQEDPDTCRICRGEGSVDEPLFYPCKCSGSIKFVHQDCLMEWLSHSQKKHCELCKTPFRFTKLYSPTMPNKLPTSVFIEKAMKHLLSHLLVWIRGAFVGAVWLVALPWCMRYAWRIVFWVGDAGWARNTIRDELMDKFLDGKVDGLMTGTSPVNSSLIDSILSAPTNAHSLPKVPPYLDIKSQTLDFTLGDHFAVRLVKAALHKLATSFQHTSVMPKSLPMAHHNSTLEPLLLRMTEQEQSSILSEIPFLRNLTSNPKTNRAIMDVLEGQIITLSVVVAFILIFLIREWVVQQQPVVDMGAADADNALAQAGGGVQNYVPDDGEGEGGEAAGNEAIGAENVETTGEVTDETPAAEIKVENEEHLNNNGTVESGTSTNPAEDQDESQSDPVQKVLETLPDEVQSLYQSGRSLEERNREDHNATPRAASGNNPAPEDDTVVDEHPEDEQRSQDSAGSWQHVSDEPLSTSTAQNSELARGPNDASQPSHVTAGDIENDSRTYQFSQPQNSEATPNDFSEAANTPESEPRDDASWMSTVDSNESYTHDDLGMGDNTFTADDVATPRPSPDAIDSMPAPTEDNAAPTEEVPAQQDTVIGQVCDWFWGDIAPIETPAAAAGVAEDDEDDEHIVEDIAAEAPFVPFAQAQPVPLNAPNPAAVIPPDVAAAAGIDPNDPDAVEDAEDLEGILELIGMQGPIVGLIQNAIFSAVLIFLSIMAAVWTPYLYGKIVLLATREPELLYKVPLRLGTMIADLIIDVLLILGGYATYLFGQAYRFILSWFSVDVDSLHGYRSTTSALQVGRGAVSRLFGGASAAADFESKDFLYLSMECHGALDSLRLVVKTIISSIFGGIAMAGHFFLHMTPDSLSKFLLTQIPNAVMGYSTDLYEEITTALESLWNHGFSSISLGTVIVRPDDPMSAYWTATDRALAIISGYSAVALIGALYLRIAPITNNPKWRRAEVQVMEIFQQAGGVLKVVLIISIEMIAFPLFCGFLLDVALMPLFESATFVSRFTFAVASPWTSGFVHWFVGTCYMFHFALFVSMCRRIMRSGVLYFIRDPDDPTFHPVRDVLERNVITQLRKIAFSAIVYGALIVVCLGGVVWGLWAISDNILPIHWTSSESSLEFPLDILFYNFLTPLIVKFAKPSDGLHAMYTWWFKRCARALRLSDFLFRDTYPDEEGHHVRNTWKAWFLRKQGVVEDMGLEEEDDEDKDSEKQEVYFQKDGKHVRAPASDQVRIPKGSPVFVEVDEENRRIDGKADDEGVHSKNSDMITKVYIPPWFRVRIGLFTLAVWLFAAATGISVTIVPLLFGRKVLHAAIPNANNVNDIYAFSLGIYVLGGILYSALHYKTILTFLHNTFWPSSASRVQAITTLGSYTKRVFSVLYVYSALAIGLPLLFAVLLELYILMPIHVSFGPGESHVVHLIQDWTLGILYVRIGTRILLWDRQSRAARTVQAVVRQGYLNPDARLATRAFVLPTLLAFAVLLGAPFGAAHLLNNTYTRHATEEDKIQVMRLAYPVALSCALSFWSFVIVGKATERWRARIRDEVYLIGERLHNFGDKKPVPVGRTVK